VARFSDRIGKGIRGAPGDALVGDLVPAQLRGAAYGLRQALDTVGAVAGPLLALALMESFDGPAASFLGGAIFAVASLVAGTVFVLRARRS